MAWVAADRCGEYVYSEKPWRDHDELWEYNRTKDHICLPKGSVKKLVGKELTWEDEPVELKEVNMKEKKHLSLLEAKEKKRLLEQQITTILSDFEEQTGLRVESPITFNVSEKLGGGRKIISVHLDIVLS